MMRRAIREAVSVGALLVAGTCAVLLIATTLTTTAAALAIAALATVVYTLIDLVMERGPVDRRWLLRRVSSNLAFAVFAGAAVAAGYLLLGS